MQTQKKQVLVEFSDRFESSKDNLLSVEQNRRHVALGIAIQFGFGLKVQTYSDHTLYFIGFTMPKGSIKEEIYQ